MHYNIVTGSNRGSSSELVGIVEGRELQLELIMSVEVVAKICRLGTDKEVLVGEDLFLGQFLIL